MPKWLLAISDDQPPPVIPTPTIAFRDTVLGADTQASLLALPPGARVSPSGVQLLFGGKTPVGGDVDLTTNNLTDLLAVVLKDEYLNNSIPGNGFCTGTLGFRVTMWEFADRTKVGSLDGIQDIYFTTNISGDATVTLVNLLQQDTSRPDPSLVGCGVGLVTSVGGFTIQAKRPPGVRCFARCRWWCETFEELP